MKKIEGVCFPDIDVSTPIMIEKSKTVASYGFQLDNLREALQYVTNWNVAIDGGANIGTWTHELSNHFNVIHSIELAPDTFECLQQNIQFWDIESKVHLMNRALSDNNTSFVGVAEGTVRNPRSGGRHISGTGKIQTITIDEMNLDDLGFLKLDLEGHEAIALEGARHTIERCRPVILIENKLKLVNRYNNSHSAISILENLGARLQCKVGANQADWIFSW